MLAQEDLKLTRVILVRLVKEVYKNRLETAYYTKTETSNFVNNLVTL